MKKNLMYLMICFVLAPFSSFAQLKVNSSGNVGIGVVPDANHDLCSETAIFKSGTSYTHLIIGSDTQTSGYNRAMYPSINHGCWVGLSDKAFNTVYSYNFTNPSDGRQKENLRDIDNALGIVLQLKGVKYDFKQEYFGAGNIANEKFLTKLEKERKNKVGFIAQDVNNILPEVVRYDDSTDVYGINYSEIIPVLVEAMKEQQAQIEGLINDLAACCETSLKSGAITGFNDLEPSGNQAKLYQNNPNPFSTQTNIRFEIPETAQNAQLQVCNMTGTLLKTITISQRGAGIELINANEFVAGMYLYSLVCDGKIVDTKQMLLTN
ncbi:hypothetical protein MASR2M47_06820 [Draconibacterium sp.]|jgi:hypothetical protein